MTKENMTKYEDFISGDVYESKDMGNCSNNGVSNRYKELYVVAPYIELADVQKFCIENPKYKVEQFLKFSLEFLILSFVTKNKTKGLTKYFLCVSI